MSLVKYFKYKPINLDMEYLYNILESDLYQFTIDKEILKEEYSSIASENIIEVIDKKKSYFEELLYFLWEEGSEIKELRTLGYGYNQKHDLEFRISKEYPYKESEYDKAKRYFEKKRRFGEQFKTKYLFI